MEDNEKKFLEVYISKLKKTEDLFELEYLKPNETYSIGYSIKVE